MSIHMDDCLDIDTQTYPHIAAITYAREFVVAKNQSEDDDSPRERALIQAVARHWLDGFFAATERTHTPDSAEILSHECSTPDGPRDTPLDSSTTSPTHGGTPQNDELDAARNDLAGMRDALKQIMDALDLHGAHEISAVVEHIQKLRSAHGGTAPHPEMGRINALIAKHFRTVCDRGPAFNGEIECRWCACGPSKQDGSIPHMPQCPVGLFEADLEAGTAAASLSQKEEKEKDD